MGNRHSERSCDNNGPLDHNSDTYAIYKVIGPNGGGELVDLMKAAQKTKDLTQVDAYIQNEVVKFLLNNGEGEEISVRQLVMCRNTYKIKNFVNDGLNNTDYAEKEYETKQVCSDIYQRGSSGESLMHLCFQNNTQVHIELAKRMLLFFPNLINDFKVNDEHYGETVLHMAIVNEDPFMVKYLLNMGADCNQRCCGKFFFPDDQQNERVDSLQVEWPSVPANTNYEGFCYFGEYPLSFAAVLDQEECVRLLLVKGADPNKQDSNGNTVLHLLVIYDNLKIIQLIYEYKARTDITNNRNFTPISLAAELGRKEIYFYMLEQMRVVYWTYANITCAAYPLANIDTISQDGSINTKSALHIILDKDTEEHLELLDTFLYGLLIKKWEAFIKLKFYFELAIFVIFFALNALAIFLKRSYYGYLTDNNCTHNDTANTLKQDCQCAYYKPLDSDHYFRTIVEIVIVLYTLVFVLITLNEIYVKTWRLFLTTLLKNPTRIFFLFCLIFILMIVPLRFACNTYGEDILVTLTIIFLAFSALYFARGFRFICVFVYNLHLIVGLDITRFFIIYAIFLIGFSQTFYVMFDVLKPDGTERVFDTGLQAILDTFILTLAEVAVDFENFSQFSSYKLIGAVLFTIYLCIGNCLLLNMLIAMMDFTQQNVQERENEWIRQWGKQVLAVEQNINPKERLKQQLSYSHILSTGEISLIFQWKQTEEERKNIIEEKYTFRDNIKELENQTSKRNNHR